MRRPPGKGWTFAGALVLVLGAAALGGVIGAFAEDRGGEAAGLPRTSAADPVPRASGSIAGIAARAMPGVVTLRVAGGGSDAMTGTGIVLDTDGHILTNNHVVASAGHSDASVTVGFHDGRSAAGRVVGADSGYDLAVVQVPDPSGLTPLTLGDSDAVRSGDPVIAIGAPYDLAGSVTYGVISATHRPITTDSGGDVAGSGAGNGNGGGTGYVDALQTDAPLNPGNSGGPLIDGGGRVIGINSAIRSADGDGSVLPSGSEGGSIGLGFAIPVDEGERVAGELIDDGKAAHPVLGVTLDSGYDGDGARIGGPAGSGGKAVDPGGPSERAGVEEGDVVTGVDGEVVRSAEELTVKVRSRSPGDVLRLSLRRAGKSRTVRLTLGSAGGG